MYRIKVYKKTSETSEASKPAVLSPFGLSIGPHDSKFSGDFFGTASKNLKFPTHRGGSGVASPPRIGKINILKFDEETGFLHTQMSGSCSGCASSTETLKMGVENTLMHFIEEIKGVTSEDDPMFNDPYYVADHGMMDFPPMDND